MTTKSTLVSLRFKGLTTKHGVVKWDIALLFTLVLVILCFNRLNFVFLYFLVTVLVAVERSVRFTQYLNV